MKKREEQVTCKYTTGVNCPEEGRCCERCGHNPEVSARRLEAIRKKLGVEA